MGTLDKPVTRLSFVVSQTNDPDWSCDPAENLEPLKWHFIALSVQKNQVQVFYNSKKVCDKTNDQGTAVVPEAKARHMLVGDPFRSAVAGRIYKLIYYEGQTVNEGMLKAMQLIDPPTP